MINQITRLWQEPFPQGDDNKSIIKYSLVTGLIVSFILMVFKPFGFSEAPADEAIKYALIFGAMGFVGLTIYLFFIKYVLKIKQNHPSWTFGKWMLNNFVIILLFTCINYFFTVYSYGLPHSMNHLFGIFWSALTIGVFPITLLGLLVLVQQSTRNERIASEINIRPVEIINKQPNLVRLPIHQSDKFFEINADQIICIEAMQNYVHIYFDEGEEISKKIIRNTISDIEQALEQTNILRSHRSFLVNTSKIEAVSGNAQGLKLEINPSPGFWIPVSRKYIPIFRNIA